jgi:hypothetical protein
MLLPQLKGGRVVDPERPDIVWRKSSLSDSGTCVEVGFSPKFDLVALRHSKSPAGPILTFTPEEWAAFVGGVHLGEFEPPDRPSATA